ncbi:sulfite exporter TauE/SafE family protein [Actinomycetospora callitridis]|uniref:sulfite exporter TauE/SafE family protein n=1 Tax=Actinomycetospora callitridis TaxID=913944 RepID=UPI002366D1E2|nr:sulfite exporter TauE/SafE family protein [Actinomycetospora callitridis]MDD7921158.1 sulfite exporter TauE/SafE family protein [Actinomycetospora callitridis]
MRAFLLFALAGLIAQLVDGSLGMAYGVTSTSVLLAAGTAPAIASASVHLAEVGTTLASGASHWRFGNVDWRVVGILAVPGAVGAVLGAYVLVNMTEDAEPYMAGILLLLGVYVLLRFSSRAIAKRVVSGPRPGGKFLGPLGLVAGFLDASGGGGWGPVATSSLLASGRLEPRKVVGSVDTSEFVVALAASIGFLFTLSQEGIDYTVVLALMVGGVIAAPFAAYIVRLLPARVLGTGAGGLIIITNARTLLNGFDVATGIVTTVLIVLAVLWVVAIVVAVRSARRERALNESAVVEEDSTSAA